MGVSRHSAGLLHCLDWHPGFSLTTQRIASLTCGHVELRTSPRHIISTSLSFKVLLPEAGQALDIGIIKDMKTGDDGLGRLDASSIGRAGAIAMPRRGISSRPHDRVR